MGARRASRSVLSGFHLCRGWSYRSALKHYQVSGSCFVRRDRSHRRTGSDIYNIKSGSYRCSRIGSSTTTCCWSSKRCARHGTLEISRRILRYYVHNIVRRRTEFAQIKLIDSGSEGECSAETRQGAGSVLSCLDLGRSRCGSSALQNNSIECSCFA